MSRIHRIQRLGRLQLKHFWITLNVVLTPEKHLICLFVFPSLGVERGKIEFQELVIGLSQCEYVSFSSSFSSGTRMRVFASVNHEHVSSGVHDSVFIWVEAVTTSGFRACLVKGGRGTGGNTTIDWFAFQGSQSGVYHGETSFSLFTTGRKCNQLNFPQVRLNLAMAENICQFPKKYRQRISCGYKMACNI